MRHFTITQNDAGQRIDKFVAKVAPHMPRSMLFKSFRNRRIKCNNKPCDYQHILKQGDIVQLNIYEEFYDTSDLLDFTHAPAQVSVVYEDENILLLDKPSGLLIHGSKSKRQDTLLDRALHYLYKKGVYCPKKEHSFSPAFINRLDRNTSGLVIMAKNFPTLQCLSEKMKQREISRYYLCQVVGSPSPQEGILTGYHTKDHQRNMVTISSSPSEESRKVETHYTVLRSDNNTSWLEVNLITGRSHQIRAHLGGLGHPLVGDRKYGYHGDRRFQELYAYKVSFDFLTPAGHLEYLKGKSYILSNLPIA